MPEWKELLAGIAVCMLIAWILLPRVAYGPLLDDPEFDAALWRAQEGSMPHADYLRSYPFTVLQRHEAAAMYVWRAEQVGIVSEHMSVDAVDPVDTQDATICQFTDLESESQVYEMDVLIAACQYGFLRGSHGRFHPFQYLSKAESLVALMRVARPEILFEETDPYWDSYVEEAYREGITIRPTSPYLMYLISWYEFVLQLYRATQTFFADPHL